ncbi:hypothetical protein ACLIYM_03210 [Streptomyces fenghuangensis]|uniref:hypothetical protein n=1 Tax=Streptomyces sp. ICN903 TaxID=2964654 RepID=UPI001EDA9787|nr:hypothetical protein [Streptomyces sp. ICN903]MCG3041557.1 hypothetical protein [Streptomyces sp. ICN903]
MNQNTHHQAPAGGPLDNSVTLPDELRGPFLFEITPDGPYRHIGLQQASVVHYRNGGHSVITVRGARHHNRPRLGRRPVSVCLIAQGRHQTSFEMRLPTRGDEGNFTCAVDIHWEVQDFLLAAEKRVVDVERMLRAPLLARLRTFTRRYGLDGAQQADEAIQAELATGNQTSLGADIGLATTVYVRIDLGRAAADHKQALLDVQHTAIVQSARDQADAARVQSNLAAAQELIAAGEAGQYAHMLAQDPARAQEILHELQGQARQQRQGALEYLTRLIDQGVVQRHQVEGQVQQLIDYARATGRALFDSGLPQPPTALPVPPADPAPGPRITTAWEPAAPSADTPPVPLAPGTPPMPPVPPVPPEAPSAVPPGTAETQDGPPAGSGGGRVNYIRQERHRPSREEQDEHDG